MRLFQRVNHAVANRSSVLITRADLASLGESSQMTVVLRKLVDQGELIRLSRGIYVKAKRNAHGEPTPITATEVIVDEVVKLLGILPEDAWTEIEGPSWRVAVRTPQSRVHRTLQVGSSRVVIFALRKADRMLVPENSAELPRLNVRGYIERLAHAYYVTGERTNLDRWSDAVSRAAGDSSHLDRVGRLLSRLKQKRVISGVQMAHLMTNYLAEKGASRYLTRLNNHKQRTSSERALCTRPLD